MTVKSSYLIFVLLKNSNFFWKLFLQYSTHFCKIPKVVIENFIGTKSWRKILEKLKRKVDIFIETKNIFKHYIKVFLSVCILHVVVAKKKLPDIWNWLSFEIYAFLFHLHYNLVYVLMSQIIYKVKFVLKTINFLFKKLNSSI